MYRQVSLVYTEKAIHYVVRKLKKGKQKMHYKIL